ncbi:MAG: hypothetical protein JSV82_06965 [Planctomycetota bacterium]|nr:MAG: hypothetical protein JSV82_06965 [Planctomycetota bacterium]
MSKHKVGLHKKVTAIFGNVTIAKDSDAQQPSDAPIPQRPAPIPPAPSHMSPTKPKPKEPVQPPPPPKATPAKQPKADVAVEIAKQIPWQQTLEKIKSKLFVPKPGVSTTRQKKMAILFPVLSIVLIFVLFRVLSTPSRGTNQPQGFEPTNLAAGSNNKIDWQIPDPYPMRLRDPMQLGSVTIAQTETGKLTVRGIVYSEDNPSAVIDDQIVHEGDKILDATIVKINTNSVEFEINGKRWTQKVQR